MRRSTRGVAQTPDLDRRTGPARDTAILGILLGALAPGILLWLAIAAIGRLLTGPLIGWNRSESALNRSLQDTRDRTWDSVTAHWSHVGNTEIVVGVCLVVVALVSWRTRRWWFAVIPAIAVRLQREQFGRGDGRDRSPAPGRSTSGPRATDVELSKWLSRRQRRALRPPRHHGHRHQADLIAPHRDWVCSVIPVLVAYARLYRGMHYLSDVVVGAINGLVCAALAASCLLHQPSWFNCGHR